MEEAGGGSGELIGSAVRDGPDLQDEEDVDDDAEGEDGQGGDLGIAGADLSADVEKELRSLCGILESAGANQTPACDQLRAAPTEPIVDKFSSVLLDPFHALDRVKVKMHHSYKKAYFYALMCAWLAYDHETLEAAKDALRADGMTDAEIENKMYFNADWFHKCVKRRVLNPAKLYWRVRCVFAVYGPKLDIKDGSPLFTQAAWKKADNVLDEILAGHCSDPPGYNFYHQKLDRHGEPATNKLGLPLLDCCRGTNLTECVHKQIIATFGHWHTGVEMSDTLLDFWRHTYNQGVSERRRPGFPCFGHPWTYMPSLIQLLVRKNHGVEVYESWSNEADYAPTPERFGTLPLQDEALGQAVNAIPATKLADMNLTRCELYLATAMDVQVLNLETYALNPKPYTLNPKL